MSATDRPGRFTVWRRGRPFWGGVVLIAAAIELLALSIAPLQVAMLRGLAGIGTMVIAAILATMAVIGWAQPNLRTVTGAIGIIAGLASYPVSNMGGFLVGLVLAVVGGALVVAWAPSGPGDPDPPDDSESGAGPDSPSAESEPEPAGEPGRPGTPEPTDPAPPDGTAADPEPSAPDARSRDGAPPPARDAAPRRGDSTARRAFGIAVAVLLAAGTVFAGPAPAQAAEPNADIPLPWPFPWPAPSDPDDPSDPDPGDGPDDPAEPGGDPAGPAACDPSAFAGPAPAPGTEDAARAAEAYGDCLADPVDPAAPHRADLPPLSTESATITADTVTMDGLDYHGVAELSDGRTALEFTADTVLLSGMDQSAAVDGENRLHVTNPDGDAELSGDVRLYVERIEGRLFGLLPVTFSPRTPPPVTVPGLTFTDATMRPAYVAADTLRLPTASEQVE